MADAPGSGLGGGHGDGRWGGRGAAGSTHRSQGIDSNTTVRFIDTGGADANQAIVYSIINNVLNTIHGKVRIKSLFSSASWSKRPKPCCHLSETQF